MSLFCYKKFTVILIILLFISIFTMACFGPKGGQKTPVAVETPSGDTGDAGGDITPPTGTTGTTGTTVTKPPSGKVFNVVIVTWPGFGPLFVAKEKGFFDDLNVDITIMDDTVARRSAYTGKKADAIAETLDSFASVASTIKGKAILKTDESCGGDGLVVKKSIQTINDLKGKTIAFPQGLPSHFFLIYLLNFSGLSSKDIKPQYMEPEPAAKAFIAGKVDACVTWEPFLTEAGTSPNGEILMTSADAQGLIMDIIVVRDDVIKDRPKDIQKFVTGWFRALEYCKKNPADGNKIMAKDLSLSEDDVNAMLSGIKLADLEANKAFLVKAKDPGQFVDIFDTAGSIWKDEGLIKEPVSGEKAYNQGFVQAVKPEMVLQIQVKATEVPAPTEVAVADTPVVEEPTEAPPLTEVPTAKPVVKPTLKPTPSKPKGEEIAKMKVRPIHFATGSSEIAEDSKYILDEIGKQLIHFPNLYIRVEVHTDSVGDPGMNLQLSQERAGSVKKYLLKNFPKIKKDHLIAKGYGDKKPVASNDTDQGRAKNRRTEFIIIR